MTRQTGLGSPKKSECPRQSVGSRSSHLWSVRDRVARARSDAGDRERWSYGEQQVTFVGFTRVVYTYAVSPNLGRMSVVATVWETVLDRSEGRTPGSRRAS